MADMASDVLLFKSGHDGATEIPCGDCKKSVWGACVFDAGGDG